MPKLHKYKDRDEYYVLTSIRGSIVTFQVTAEGHKKLSEAGVRSGQRFNRFLLLDLYRSGYAYTGGGGLKIASAQGELDFSDDPEPESMFPRCSACLSHDDLAIIEIRDEKHYATILCARCRPKKAPFVDASIPLPLMTKTLLNKFLTIRGINETDESVAHYKELLHQEFTKKWEALAALKKGRPIQARLIDDTSGGLL
jgi:hypothetical protein